MGSGFSNCCDGKLKQERVNTDHGYFIEDENDESYDDWETRHDISKIDTIRPQDRKDRIFEHWMNSILEGNDSFCAYLNEEYPHLNLINYTFPNGDTSLQTAILKEHNKIIVYLLQNDCDVNVLNENTANTALHYAVQKNNHKLCTLLFNEYHSDSKVSNIHGKTPYDIAKECDYSDIIELLSTNYDNFFVSDYSMNNNNINNNDNINFNEIYRVSQKMESLLEFQEIEDEKISTVIPLNKKQVKGKRIRTETLEVIPKFNRTKTMMAMRNIRSMTVQRQNLPELGAWLKKKSPTKFKGWQERFFFIKDSYLMWACHYKKWKNDRHETKEDENLNKHKNHSCNKDYNGLLSLVLIKDVKEVKEKQKCQFVLMARDPKNKKSKKIRRYLLKAKDKNERDEWIEGLKKHCDYHKNMMAYLDDSFDI